MKNSIILIIAAMVAIGCDQQRQATNDRSLDSEKSAVTKSAREAKKAVEAKADAQKERLDAEAKAAQARIDAEKARAKAEATDAQAKVDAASQQIRDAAGGAAANVQTQTGAGQSSAATPTATPAAPTATPTTTQQPGATAESDQKLTDQVRSAVTGGANETSEAAKNIQVSVSGGTATLKGTVKTDAEKQQAESAAKAVPGVTKVENEIQVKTE